MTAYESLRIEVVNGRARPGGLGAVVYHGMLHALALMMSETAVGEAVPGGAGVADHAAPRNRQLVQLLANMLLRTQREVRHVY